MALLAGFGCATKKWSPIAVLSSFACQEASGGSSTSKVAVLAATEWA
jgi:hypothetical protein